MAAPRPPVPAVLMDELVEDCLLRLPPEDPADLARAALVSRQWHRVVTGAVFRRSFVSGGDFSHFTMGSVLVGNTLYFARESNHGDAIIIFKYDLPTHQMSTISLQCEVQMNSGVLIATEDGRLGVAVTSNSTICLWLREQGRLVESRVSQLHALPDDWVAAFADTGAGAIFLSTRFGYFTMDLNSGRSKKVGESLGSADIVPYMSFCTPASGKIVCTDEGPGACVVVSTDDEPRAGVTVSGDEGLEDFAVSTDEGPGDFVVSTDEGPGPSMSSA